MKNLYDLRAGVRDLVPLDATQNGWKRENNKLIPDWSEDPTLPEKLEDILQNDDSDSSDKSDSDIESDRDSTDMDCDDSFGDYSSSEDEY